MARILLSCPTYGASVCEPIVILGEFNQPFSALAIKTAPGYAHHGRLCRMTPLVSDSVMKRLPSLPKQYALIFGNAVNLPTTFTVRDVKAEPISDDPASTELWFRPSGEEIELQLPG